MWLFQSSLINMTIIMYTSMKSLFCLLLPYCRHTVISEGKIRLVREGGDSGLPLYDTIVLKVQQTFPGGYPKTNQTYF